MLSEINYNNYMHRGVDSRSIIESMMHKIIIFNSLDINVILYIVTTKFLYNNNRRRACLKNNIYLMDSYNKRNFVVVF